MFGLAGEALGVLALLHLLETALLFIPALGTLPARAGGCARLAGVAAGGTGLVWFVLGSPGSPPSQSCLGGHCAPG